MRFTRKTAKNKSRNTLNNVRLIRGGAQYFREITEAIARATDTVHLQTYIFEADETGQQVAEALMEAARRGVRVYMLVDGYASQGLPKQFISKLVDAGVRFRFFEPLFKSRHFYFGRRLHSKVVVIDACWTIVGGVNITDRYNDMPSQPAWLDFALLAEGPAAEEACRICQRNWKGYLKQREVSGCEPSPNFSRGESKYTAMVRLRKNDWVRNMLQISNSYLQMFRSAKSHITILSSYALPGNVFRTHLQRAVKRGVKVKMIISGQSDVIFVKQAERYWYDWLLRNNIEIYEYTRNVLHGKLAVCDSEWLTIGSYNINDLSAYASVELNFDVMDDSFARNVEDELEAIIQNDCVPVSKEQIAATRNVFTRVGRWFSYNILRATFNLFTFYYRQQK